MAILRRIRENWRRDAAYRRAKDILRYPLHHSSEQIAWAQLVIAEDARKKARKAPAPLNGYRR